MPIAILGVVFIIFGVLGFISNRSAQRKSDTTDATVVGMERMHVRRGGYSYFPLLEYVVDGVIYVETPPAGNISPKYKDGEIVKIIYSIKDPRKMDIEGSNSIAIASFFLILGGVGLLWYYATLLF